MKYILRMYIYRTAKGNRPMIAMGGRRYSRSFNKG